GRLARETCIDAKEAADDDPQRSCQSIDTIDKVEGVDDDNEEEGCKQYRGDEAYLPYPEEAVEACNAQVEEEGYYKRRHGMDHDLLVGPYVNKVILHPYEEDKEKGGEEIASS